MSKATSPRKSAIYPDLAGKVAVITGAGKGIGLDCVRELVYQGCQIIAISRTKADLDAIAAKYKGKPIKTYCLDITDYKGVEKLFAGIDKVDLLVNNAGVIGGKFFCDTTEEEYDRYMDINMKGSFHVGQCCARIMIKNKVAGSIVNLSSIVGRTAAAGFSAYSTSKAGVDGLTKSMASDLGPYGIRVNSCNPTFTRTNATEAFFKAGKLEVYKEKTPLGRLGQPVDCSRVIAFLLSEMAAYVTGESILVDGGLLSRPA